METTKRGDGTMGREGITLTKIVETKVLGTRAYHAECDCGWSSRRVDRESDALRTAKSHAANHGTPLK